MGFFKKTTLLGALVASSIISPVLVDDEAIMKHPSWGQIWGDSIFITNWKTQIDGKVVFEMPSSQFVSKNPIVKFKIKGAKKVQEIKMTWVDLAEKQSQKQR